MPAADAVILIRQYRYTIDRWIWELPAGTLKPGEDPAAGAARECEEEIALVPGRVERLRALYPTPGFCDEQMIFFRCTELTAAGGGLDGAERRGRGARTADVHARRGAAARRHRRDRGPQDGGWTRAASLRVAAWMSTVSAIARA